MSAPSCTREHLTSWERRGSGAAVDVALEQHLESCDECADEHDAIVETRRRLEDLPVRRIAADRLDAIRFQLIAATRAAGRPARERPEPAPTAPSARPARVPARRISRPLVALLAAAIGLAVALAVVLRGRQAPSAAVAAEIELADGASGVRAQDGPDEVFSLVRGTARFHVRHLRPGERFRVVAGGDTVEVRGTRFTVEAEDGRVGAVEVQEGTVVLSLLEGGSWVLGAGQSWRRPLLASSSAPAVSAETAGELPRSPLEPAPTARPDGRVTQPASAASAAASAAGPASATPSAAAGASAAAASSASRRADERAAFDGEFQRALDLLHRGRASEAAAAFDALRASPSADAGRAVDALYWAARAYAQAGQASAAEERARRVVETQPGSWHADDAALLLGEAMMRRGDAAGARPWLERAARSPRESIRTRATRALEAHGPN